jgi:hypothetical protein
MDLWEEGRPTTLDYRQAPQGVTPPFSWQFQAGCVQEEE